jgi:hypothetical protein
LRERETLGIGGFGGFDLIDMVSGHTNTETKLKLKLGNGLSADDVTTRCFYLFIFVSFFFLSLLFLLVSFSQIFYIFYSFLPLTFYNKCDILNPKEKM